MKTSDIEQIIKNNPHTVFYRSAGYKEYFTIEGFTFEQRTKYAQPTKVAITRGVHISIDSAENTATICIAPQTQTRTLTQITGTSHANADAMQKAVVKARILVEAEREVRAKNHANLGIVGGDIRAAFDNHNIDINWNTIQVSPNNLTLTLTLEQAQALLNIIEG
ncbi:hypothetical protein UFOVP526_30 [uncultured Caudovirales phage]|uniref:Uncharacterized protein n=1 Tax=uncultured Caudovirales phage TaxID=2100421 RepID=A0A6J5MUU6_9CAUD|nr:hypothetical protein UFOVP526_30 [uncultured Caudovirales phage]